MNNPTCASAILSPRSVAVVGVSGEPTKIGARIFRNIVGGGFTGGIFPVNRGGESVGGHPAYRSLEAIDTPVELVVVAVPAHAVEGVVRSAVAVGAKTIVIISAGFAELGGAGGDVERRLVACARGAGARLIGPNCFGVMNADPAVRLNATFGKVPLCEGPVAFASQSGACGILFLEGARRRGLGVGRFVSLGNSADIGVPDLITAWGEDPAISVIALYLEGIADGAALIEAGRAVCKKKPIVALHAGRTPIGAAAARSHTAAVTAGAAGIDAVLECAGIVRVEGLETLLEATSVSVRIGVPRGPRVGVVTNAGGPGILFADRATARGLDVAPISPHARGALQGRVAAEASIENPIDLTAAATPEHFELALTTLGGEVDVVVALVVDIGILPVERFVEVVRVCAKRGSTAVRWIVILPSRTGDDHLKPMEEGTLATVATLEGGADALGALVAAGRAMLRQRYSSPFDKASAAQLHDLGSTWEHGRWLVWGEIEQLLRRAGIPCVQGWEGELDRAAAAGGRLGFPLVAKLLIPGVQHKSDIGGVVTGIRDEERLTSTLEEFRRIAAHREGAARVLLQPHIEGGREGFVGLSLDPHLGALIACGWGGTNVEALGDIALGVPPVGPEDAHAMVEKLRFRTLLAPFRGAPPHDRAGFEAILVRVGALTTVLPEIVECDLNPIRILPEGAGCLVLDARVRVIGRGVR